MGRIRLSKVSIRWSPSLAYAIGLITTDGNLSPDGRHISFCTKDLELAQTYHQCLGLDNKIGTKSRGDSHIKNYFVVQFGDKNFYEFLESIGLTKAKSKTLGSLKIPSQFFAHFLRGCIDGDGNINVFVHPESEHPQLKLRLYAYNQKFLTWVHRETKNLIKVGGGWIYSEKDGSMNALVFGKADSITILRYIYSYNEHFPCLTRKYEVALQFLD